MTLVDTNILVYATFSDAPEHERARNWLEAELAGDGSVALCWPVVYAFVRLITSPRVFGENVFSVSRVGRLRRRIWRSPRSASWCLVKSTARSRQSLLQRLD